ncbi:MAG: hypothetical protein ABGX83_05025 [Nitrospira sp.]|nr:hypothetical protein [Candidatus Manganitrophaceae bacterium]HIL34839.1 hypothetical protein [Candidatus Manganitrophaceae bacterium]
MGIEGSGMDRIADAMRRPIEQYMEQMRGLAASNGLALTLYGAITAGSFDKKRHTVRSVFVLKKVDLKMLRELAKNGMKLGKTGIAAPLIMTPEYINASLDTFPLELIEIQQSHLTLFGEDYFKALSFEDDDIRHACERELKSILIGMRQGLLAAAGREKLFAEVEADIAERLIRTLRGILWLKGKKEPHPALEVANEVEKVIEFKLPGLKEVLRMSGEHGWDEFVMLYGEIEVLVEIVDAW